MTTMQYGVVLPYGSARETAEQARLAEESGWNGVFVGDAIWCQDPLILLTAAAMTTQRIRLVTMVLAMPLRDPRHLASESLALDRLSGGRLTLGLATGATWMGWAGFPDFPTDVQTRNEMLSESIDILTLMHQSKQFDYNGKYYQVKLSQLDPMHYPPPTLQQPRVPIWIPGIWPRKKNMQRVLKCDGIFPQKMTPEGQSVPLAPEDVREIKAYIDKNRVAEKPFDIVVEGKTAGLERQQARETVQPWVEAGATWWVESTWGMEAPALLEVIRQGPPR